MGGQLPAKGAREEEGDAGAGEGVGVLEEEEISEAELLGMRVEVGVAEAELLAAAAPREEVGEPESLAAAKEDEGKRDALAAAGEDVGVFDALSLPLLEGEELGEVCKRRPCPQLLESLSVGKVESAMWSARPPNKEYTKHTFEKPPPGAKSFIQGVRHWQPFVEVGQDGQYAGAEVGVLLGVIELVPVPDGVILEVIENEDESDPVGDGEPLGMLEGEGVDVEVTV